MDFFRNHTMSFPVLWFSPCLLNISSTMQSIYLCVCVKKKINLSESCQSHSWFFPRILSIKRLKHSESLIVKHSWFQSERNCCFTCGKNTDWEPHMTDIRHRIDKRSNGSRFLPKLRDNDNMLEHPSSPRLISQSQKAGCQWCLNFGFKA